MHALGGFGIDLVDLSRREGSSTVAILGGCDGVWSMRERTVEGAGGRMGEDEFSSHSSELRARMGHPAIR